MTKITDRETGTHIWAVGEARSNLARQYVAVQAARETLEIEERDLVRAMDRMKTTRRRLIAHLVEQGLSEADAVVSADLPVGPDGYERFPQLVEHADEIAAFVGGELPPTARLETVTDE